jgi:hypothetical protein
MSALSLKADMCGAPREVRFGPIADIGPPIRSPRRLLRAEWPAGSRPRALAVFELITNSYLVGCCAGVSSGRARQAMHLGKFDAIAGCTARFGHLAKLTDCRQLVRQAEIAKVCAET